MIHFHEAILLGRLQVYPQQARILRKGAVDPRYSFRGCAIGMALVATKTSGPIDEISNNQGIAEITQKYPWLLHTTGVNPHCCEHFSIDSPYYLTVIHLFDSHVAHDLVGSTIEKWPLERLADYARRAEEFECLVNCLRSGAKQEVEHENVRSLVVG